MLAHCVNPDCYSPLRSFCEGRLFQFEIVSISIAANDATSQPFDEKPERRTAHFWLCGRCSDRMTLVLEPFRGLRVVPVGVEPEEAPSAADFSVESRDQAHRYQ